MEPTQKPKGFLIVAIVLIIAGLVVYFMMNKKAPEVTVEETEPVATSTEPTPTSPKPATTTSETALPVISYKNGTYSATGDYTSPGGAETIGLSITLKNDVIVDAQFTAMATRAISKQMQDIFAANYKVLVIGKNIDEVKLGKVSSSSLTPKGFNDALAKIKVQAKA